MTKTQAVPNPCLNPHALSCALALTLGSMAAPSTSVAQPVFVEIAREFTGGLMWLEPDVRPSLAENGTVAFGGTADFYDFDDQRVFVGDGGALTLLDIAAAGLLDLGSVQLNDAGQIAIAARRVDGADTYRGAYTTTTGSGVFATLYEGRSFVDPSDDEPTPVGYNVAMSPNGTIGFSSIVNSYGSLYRSPFAGPLTQLREGTGIYYNTMQVDVNDAGQVAVQMEYTDPTAGLSRGILIFDTPGDTLTTIVSGIERGSVGLQAQPAINAAGTVAFAINFTTTMTFFDPPGVFGTVLEEVTLEPGVYRVTPTPWGAPKHPVLIAGAASGYSSFGRVVINDLDEVAFEAAANGEFGVFVGPDPIAHKVLATGDIRGDQLFSWIRLGEINNAGEITLLTSDYNSTDRQVWRVDNVFPRVTPPPPPPSPRELLRALIRRLLRLFFGL